MGVKPTQGAKKRQVLGFVTGHGFSRAAQVLNNLGLAPADVFFDRGIMGLPPTQGDEKRRQPLPIDPPPSPCHPDRSEAEWRDPWFAQVNRMCFSRTGVESLQLIENWQTNIPRGSAKPVDNKKTIE